MVRVLAFLQLSSLQQVGAGRGGAERMPGAGLYGGLLGGALWGQGPCLLWTRWGLKG